MLRSMYSGISGMKNFQTKLDVIGNNIANVNTAGFKKSRVTFKDTMNQMVAGAASPTDIRGGRNATQVGLGSTLATIDVIHSGSSLQTTGRALDLGIEGDGYFIVNQGNSQFYSRAGNFYLDDNGSLVNSDGLKVQAYNNNGVLGDVIVNVNASLPAVTTKEIAFEGNLAADANIGTVFSQQIKTVDENGNAHASTVYFKKMANDQWGVFINEEPKPSSVGAVTNSIDNANGSAGNISVTNPTGYMGTENGDWKVTFTNNQYQVTANGVTTNIPADDVKDNKFSVNGLEIDLSNVDPLPPTDGDTWQFTVTAPVQPKPGFTLNFDANGNIINANAVQNNIRVDIPSGKIDDSTTPVNESHLVVDLDFSKLTQVKGSTNANVFPDGYTDGKLESFNIGPSGEINGVYSNGLIDVLGTIAIAKFSNSSGLTKAGNNLFQASVNSGTANIGVAGDGRGTLAAGSLEMSNVDLSEEFTEMITAQRGFQANTRIITTSDEILQELVNLKR
ncbi:flagellar hook protein FlgE [Cytobacillus purgationiresistens]|uniref:Flagellar hook protein FlgE n=1 Tax=Cytobacillus purgationiresistens TaxID=863449 RepID=A0ABU0AG48_9BACI|nr:flagellar hook protein FlgE [Cytobacillus purgationiresistens]